MIKNLINPIIIFITLVGACYEVSKSVEAPLLFIDFPSIFIVLVIATSYSLSVKNNRLIYFGNGAVYAGWLILLIGFISMSIKLSKTNLDIKELLELNSVLWLGVFYGYSIKLILFTFNRNA